LRARRLLVWGPEATWPSAGWATSPCQARRARQVLLDAGFAAADLLTYSSRELEPRLSRLLRVTPGSAGFGYEVVPTRRYLAPAQEDVGWLVVCTPDAAQAGRVAPVAKRFGAKSTVRYHALANEDLV
jgi:hypothetical protein